MPLRDPDPTQERRLARGRSRADLGKSEELTRRLRRAEIAGQRVVIPDAGALAA